MANTFSFGSDVKRFTIQLEKTNEDGTVEHQDLTFSCPVTQRTFLAKLNENMRAVKRMMKGENSFDDLEKVARVEKEMFDLMAPGKWEETIAFLFDDIVKMGQLLNYMANFIHEGSLNEQAAKIIPPAASGEKV